MTDYAEARANLDTNLKRAQRTGWVMLALGGLGVGLVGVLGVIVAALGLIVVIVVIAAGFARGYYLGGDR